MASLLDSLNIGGSSLATQQLGLQVTGHNISNAATAGYHRQSVLFESLGGTGSGVRASGIRRSEDRFLLQQLGAQAGNYGMASARADTLNRLEDEVGGLDDLGLSSHMDRFYSGWRELAAAPHDTFQRTEALSQTEELVGAINRMASQFQATQEEADREVVRGVAEANAMIEEVAALNQEITENEAYGGDANSLRDRRDMLVEQLGELIGATSFVNDKGHSVVTLSGGIAVVTGVEAQLLDVEMDAETGFHDVVLQNTANMTVNGNMAGGRVKGFLEVRDTEVAGLKADLDAFAADFATAVNEVHRANFNLEGNDGINLIVPPTETEGAAANLAVNEEIVTNIDLLATSSTADGVPGNGIGSQMMSDLEFEQVAGGGERTLSESVNSILGDLGRAVRDAAHSEERNGMRFAQLTTLRQSNSGVSIEEEMIQLARFQRSFQAASRIVATVDEMLQTVLAL